MVLGGIHSSIRMCNLTKANSTHLIKLLTQGMVVQAYHLSYLRGRMG